MQLSGSAIGWTAELVAASKLFRQQRCADNVPCSLENASKLGLPQAFPAVPEYSP